MRWQEENKPRKGPFLILKNFYRCICCSDAITCCEMKTLLKMYICIEPFRNSLLFYLIENAISDGCSTVVVQVDGIVWVAKRDAL